MTRSFWIAVVGFFVIGFIIYSPGIDAPRYGDDYYAILKSNSLSEYSKIWTTSFQRHMFYRPLEDTIVASFIMFFGWNTIPSHILFIFIHCMFVSFFYYVLLKLNFSGKSALFGSLFILVLQVNVTAVGGNDTLGQAATSFLSFLNLWLVFRALPQSGSGKEIKIKYIIISVIIFLACLLFKESSAAFIPMLLLLLLIKIPLLKTRNISEAKRILFILIPYISVFAIYYAVRSSIVLIKPGIGNGVYDFNLGLNIPKNFAMLVFSLFLPVSSVRVFEAVFYKDYKILLLAILCTILFVTMILYGLYISKQYKKILLIFTFMAIGFFPTVLLNHVNEQYTYVSLPYAGMIIAVGLEALFDNFKGKKKTVLIIVAFVFLLINSLSVIEKTSQMSELGWRADNLFSQLKNYFNEIPPDGSLVLINPASKELRYSAFKQPGFEPVRYTDHYLYHISGRNDFKLNVIEENELANYNKPGALILKLEGDKVVKY